MPLNAEKTVKTFGPESFTNEYDNGPTDTAGGITVTITPYANNDNCNEKICKWWFKGHRITTDSTYPYEVVIDPGTPAVVNSELEETDPEYIIEPEVPPTIENYTAVAFIEFAQNWWTATLGQDKTECMPPWTDIIRVQDIPVTDQRWDTTIHSRYLKTVYFPTTDIRYVRRVDQEYDGSGVEENIITVVKDNGCPDIIPPPGLAEAQSTSGSALIVYTQDGDGTWEEAQFPKPYEELPDDAEIVSLIEDDTFVVDGEVKRCLCDLYIHGKARWPDPPAGHDNHPKGSVYLKIFAPCCCKHNYSPASEYGNTWAGGYNSGKRQEDQANNILVVVQNPGDPEGANVVFVDLKTGEPREVDDPENPKEVIIDGVKTSVLVISGTSIDGEIQNQTQTLVDTNVPLDGTSGDIPPKYIMFATPAACFDIKDGLEKLSKPPAQGGFECKIGNARTGENLNSPVIQVNCSPRKKVVPQIDRTCFTVKNGFEKDCEKGIEIGPCEQSTPQIEEDGTCFKIKDGYEKTCETGEC